MSKRGGGELNHENWDQEDEREEAGRFQAASAEQMKGRVIKTARRRKIGGDSVNDGEKKNAFSSFGGFSAKTDASAAFSFLSKPAAAPESKTDKPAAGAFVFGSGPMYGPDYWMTENIIVVTVNYRVGPFGFLRESFKKNI